MADQNIKVNINLDLTEFNKNAKAMSDALSKVLGKDVKIFADEMTKAEGAINGAEKALKGAGSAATKTGGLVKESNKQWSNLALVVQDLPFGFRGIQNNLPALAAGFAGVTGPIYLAVSALIAIWTAFGDEITKVIFKTSEATNQNKMVSDSFKSVESSVVQASVSVDKMNFMIDQAKEGFVSKDKVVKTYNETLGKTIGQQSSFNGVVDAMKSKGQKYIELVTMMSFANSLAALSAKEAFTALMAEQKTPQESLSWIQEWGQNALGAVEYTLSTITGKTSKMTPLTDALFNVVGTVKKGQAVNAATKNVTFLDAFLKNVKTELSKFAKENNFNLFNLGGDDPKAKVSTKALDALKSQAKLYEDDIFTRRYYNLLVLEEEERVALKQAEIDKLSSDDKKAIAEDFKNRRLLIEKQTQEGISQIRAKGVENQAKFEEGEFKKVKEAYDKQLDVFDQFYKNKQNLGTGDRLLQKSIYEQEASDLQYMLDNNLISYQDYIKRLGETFKGWSNNNKAITTEAASSIIQIGNGIMSALGPSMDMLLDKSANIGEVLQKMFTDLLKQLVKVAVTAAITALLISIIFPETLAKAGITGGSLFSGLFTQGMGLGSMAFPPKKMANGGIVSGPTMGLMGEYPGASHNPEVVAPLDKLKTLIGGGSGGQFVLRGQDLLLSVNRAQKASNLKGQNISLA
jgi:tetratricopeptide (TPR) repeat protein